MDDFDGGDRYGSPMMGMLGMMGPMISVMVVMMVISTMAPILMYVIARWRQNKEPVQDPQLGIKFALGFFRQIGYQLMLLGGFMVVFAIIGKDMRGGRGDLMRPAFGLLIPGLIVWGVHNLAMQRTNRIQFPNVERLWAGYNLLATGIVGMVAVVLVFQTLFAKGDSGNVGRMAWALALVYCSAWATQGVMFLNRVLDTPSAPGATGSSTGGATASGGAEPWNKPLS